MRYRRTQSTVNPEHHISLSVDDGDVDPSGIHAAKICKIVGCKAWQGGGIDNLIKYGFIRLDEEFGGRHLFAAQRIPEA